MAEKIKTFNERVVLAQNELKAPKGQYNNYGGFAYRSAEDILEAVKPINLKHELLLNLKDEIVEVGGRIYVKAIATLCDVHSDLKIEVQAFAREAEVKKGMDDSQITGSASSYARKYALNGLYLIDDTKDADSNEQKKVIDEKNNNNQSRGRNSQEPMQHQPTQEELQREATKRINSLYDEMIKLDPKMTPEIINQKLKEQLKVNDLKKVNPGLIIKTLENGVKTKRQARKNVVQENVKKDEGKWYDKQSTSAN